jgi:hypothetical protein
VAPPSGATSPHFGSPALDRGFWRVGNHDNLREHLFRGLQRLGQSFPSDLHGDQAIQTFIAANLFLVQTLKWPLGKGSRHKRRRSFNSLGPRAKHRLVAHTNAAHIGPELALLGPRAVLAMGNAAWQACASFIPGSADLGEIGVSAARGRLYEMEITGRPIPLEVTSLPLDQNMRKPFLAAVIRHDIARFLNRHWRTDS